MKGHLPPLVAPAEGELSLTDSSVDSSFINFKTQRLFKGKSFTLRMLILQLDWHKTAIRA